MPPDCGLWSQLLQRLGLTAQLSNLRTWSYPTKRNFSYAADHYMTSPPPVINDDEFLTQYTVCRACTPSVASGCKHLQQPRLLNACQAVQADNSLREVFGRQTACTRPTENCNPQLLMCMHAEKGRTQSASKWQQFSPVPS